MERRIMGGVIALGLGSYAISYEKLLHVAMAAGIPWYMAVVYGFLTEGFITIATMSAVTLRGGARLYAWLVTALAFGFSLWANAAPQSIPGEVVRAIPVLAVPLAVHLGLLMHEAKAKSAQEAEASKTRERLDAAAQREAEVNRVAAQVEKRRTEVERYAAEVAAKAADVDNRASEVERNAAEVAAGTPEPIDFATVSVDDIPEGARELLAARIMAVEAPTPQTRSYWGKKVRELQKGNLTVAVA